METLSMKVIRNITDNYGLTEQEAIGMARYLLWMTLDGD